MTIRVRVDSLYQFADPIFDERQGEFVWGVGDPPDPVAREDDQFYEVREGDRFDLIAHKMLGDARYFWIILHYNGIKSALDIENYIAKEIRLPSRTTVQRIYINASQQSNTSENNS